MRWPWKKAETDLDRELQYHLQILADGFERDGATREEALRRARLEFGGVERVKDECRDERRTAWLSQFARDLRFGWRMLLRQPAVAAAAVISLALGIGATTAIVSLADSLLWRRLGVPAPEQLVEVQWEYRKRPDGLVRASSGSGYRDGALSVMDFFGPAGVEAMRRSASGHAEVAAHMSSAPASATFGGVVMLTRLRPVSGNFFRMLGVRPIAGRLLDDEDARAGAAPVVVLTHRFWRSSLGGREAPGLTLRVNNVAYTIAGVLPSAFTGIVPGDDTDLYAPILHSPSLLRADSWYRNQLGNPTSWWLQVLARRAPAATHRQLHALLQAGFASSWSVQPKSGDETPRIRLVDAANGLGSVRRSFGNPIAILLVMVALVLAVACANIANVLLARGVEREKEAALRVSLGCGRARLMRQFITESLLLALIGGVLSIGVAAAAGALIASLLPAGQAMTLDGGLDARSLGATAAVTVLTALCFGLYPAWRASRVDPSPSLKEGAGSSGGRRRWAPAKALVLVQYSLGVPLVTGALVFSYGLNRIVNRETGFERAHVLIFEVAPGELGYKDQRLRIFYARLERSLAALPGVESAAVTKIRPMRGGGFTERVALPGAGRGVQSAVHFGTASFLDALGVPVVAGRGPTAHEVATGAKVAVIAEDLAGELGLAAPIGARIHMFDEDYLVVGVARNARYSRLTQAQPVTYLPFGFEDERATVVIRTSIPPPSVVPAARAAVRALDPDMPLIDVFTMEQQISRTLQRERMFAWLCGSFGVLALLLCVVGLYGLMSHAIARRTAEIGIRMAVGATRAGVLRLVLGEGLRLTVIGLAIGLPLAWWAIGVADTMKILPDGPPPYWTLGAAGIVLALAGVAAVLVPASRASSVDPMRALRQG
ncbi:MAG: ABC transporter permease [Bryobacteraceae bacterium]